MAVPAFAQVAGSGNVKGTVLDPSGAAVPKAAVTIHNPVSGYERSTESDSAGQFSFSNVPFDSYHLTVTAAGFADFAQDVAVRSGVPVDVKAGLQLAGTTQQVTVESAPDLIETTPTSHTTFPTNFLTRYRWKARPPQLVLL
jgi:Carboxypeptidase regulatory-like domain